MSEVKIKDKFKSPLKAIRDKCLDCCVYQKGEVLNCTAYDCSIYPFRLGKNPNRKKTGITT